MAGAFELSSPIIVEDKMLKMMDHLLDTAPIPAGAALQIQPIHHNRTIALDTTAGSVLTLPQAFGTGLRFRAIVSVVSTAHKIRVGNATDVLRGSMQLLDNDSTAATAYAATSTDDTLTLNSTTTGGQVGDWVELCDILKGFWAINGVGVVPAGSNIADPFSAAVS